MVSRPCSMLRLFGREYQVYTYQIDKTTINKSQINCNLTLKGNSHSAYGQKHCERQFTVERKLV